MHRALWDRESGAASLLGAAAFGPRPQRFLAAAAGDAGLARRLAQVAALPGHSGAVNALAWTEGGELLASGGEDCRLRLWRGATGELLHCLDTGHTADILAACFLPASRGDQVICCSADRQIRHLNVTKGAVRPYLVHSGRVRAVVPLDAHLFLSASEDGTVREFDVRQRPAAVHREALAGGDANVLVDQRAERVGRSRVRVGILSLAVDQQRPWLMLTGGADPLLRLYDRRMLLAAGAGGGSGGGGGTDGHAGPGGRPRAPQWVACYAPSHLKSVLLDSGRHPALAASAGGAAGEASPAGRHVTAVSFARGGSEVVGSYSGDLIYSFDTAGHARDVDSLLHIPESALRAPARPRSHVGRRSMHAFTPASDSRQPQRAPPDASGAAGAAAVEGAGGTAPGAADQPPAGALAAQQAGLLLQQHHQQQQQQRRPPASGRAIAIAPSVRQLERQRRQQSRVAAAAAAEAGEAPRAESSRPAHWQLRPTSSTLRSPLHEQRQQQQQQQQHQIPRQHHHNQHQQQQQQQQAVHHHQQHQQTEPASDSEGASEGASPEGHHQQRRRRQGVRRSRRIMRRRRDEEEAAAEGEEEHQKQQQQQQQQQQWGEGLEGSLRQLPALSGVAEPPPASSSDSGCEGQALRSPARRGRRVRRRLGGGSAADENAALFTAPQQPAEAGTHAAAAAGNANSGFMAPPGKLPQHPQRQAAGAAAAAAAAGRGGAGTQRLDSTVGLLHYHAPPQHEASEVAAGSGGGAMRQQAQHEATVSMGTPLQQQQLLPAGAAAGAVRERSPAVEVNSRPVLSASRLGLATQLGSQQAGHEASSLNSAEQPTRAHPAGSVAQRARADAPSVGNAPTAGAGGGSGGGGVAAAAAEHQLLQQQQQQQQQQAADGREASTGHNVGPRFSMGRMVPPPPQFGAQQQQAAAQQAAARQLRQLQPTASTGTSRPPPAFGGHHHQRYLPPQASGRQGSRLRRHSGGLDAWQHAEAAAAELGSQAVEAAGAAAAAGPQQEEPSGPLPQALSLLPQRQQQPQATMLSGRGPSVLGDFMPGGEQPVDSEIQQHLRGGSTAAENPTAAGTRQQQQQQQQQHEHQAATEEAQHAQQPPQQAQQRGRRQVASNIGAIVLTADAAGGEEVSEPLMYRRCYAGHLNLGGSGGQAAATAAAAASGLPLAPQIAFMGAQSELLVSPSDDGNLFIWHYASGRLAAVLPAGAAAGPASSARAASSGGGAAAGDDGVATAAAVACVAPHPLLPVLASGGADSVVKLWSPEAEQQCNLLRHAAAAVQANLERLAEGGMQQVPDGVLLGGGGRAPLVLQVP